MAARFVGIDAGGTGTRAALVDADGRVVAVGEGGPSGSRGGASGVRALRHALEAALSPIARQLGDVSCVAHAGVRGISIAGRLEAARLAIAAQLPGASLTVSNDAVIALHGGLAGQPGVAVLAGTGSIAIARRSDGAEFRVGGYGYLLSDEGSGFWLGREAITHCLRAMDGRAPPTALGEALCQSAGVGGVADLVGWVYGATDDQVPRLAALAPIVARCATQHDAVARNLLERAAGALAELAAAAARLAWPESLPSSLAVARCGGLWQAGPLLVSPFETLLQAALPEARAQAPRLPGVGGAVLLAMAAGQVRPATDQMVDRLHAALAEAGL